MVSHLQLRVTALVSAGAVLYGHVASALFGGDLMMWQLAIFIFLALTALAGEIKDRHTPASSAKQETGS